MYLYGASGHGQVIKEIAEDNNIKIEGFLDDNLLIEEFLNYPVLHTPPKNTIEVIISIGENVSRKMVAERNPTFIYPTLIHPKTFISRYSSVDIGTVIMPGVSVNAGTKIGKHCIINTNASVDHNCFIEDFVHICPNVSLAGDVYIGENSHIGIGSCVIQGIKIGKNCTIGAGSVIINNIPDNATVVGNPGRIIKILDK